VKNQSIAISVTALLAALAVRPSIAQHAPTSDGPLEEIIVTGSQLELPEPFAGGQIARGGRAGILGNLDLLETPFSSTNYTAELILNQQAESVADVLLNDPVVRVARGFGNFQELFIIRGFPAFSDDMTYNGIYGILPRQYVAAEFMERVELFRGASAFLNGAAPGGSNLGGAVNLVPKRAPNEPLTRLNVGLEDASLFHVGLDVARRFGDARRTGIRANAVLRDGETSIEDQDRELAVLAFGIDHRGERLQLAADVGYQDHRIEAPRPSVTPSGGIVNPPDAGGNFAQRWTYTDEEQLFGVVRAEYEINRATYAWGAFGLRNGEEHNVLANPTALPDGTTTAYRFDNAREDDVVSGETGVRIEFDTGSVGHRVVLSASMFSIDSRNAYAFSDFFAPFAGDLNDPFDVPPPPADFFTGGSLDSPRVTFETDTHSFALADTLSFADGLFLVTVGAREQTLETETFDYNSGASTSRYDESKLTPVGGIVYRPRDSLSFYANYIEGLVAGDIPPTVSNGLPVVNGGEALDPYQAEQVELGVKYDSGTFGTTLSLWEVTRPFGLYQPFDDPNTAGDALVFRADGEQRNRGIELSVYGQLLEQLRVLGGLTWLDAEMTHTQDGLFEGNTAVGSPDTQANVNVEWDIAGVPGLTLDARAIYTSAQYADAANDLEVSSWTRFDIGARYAMELVGRPVTVRARLDNVTDESDWVSVGGFPGANYLVLGAPRTLVLSASFDF
jgi:iron complex outermembrane receptor protein